MNALDRVISTLSPRWAASRAYYQRVLQINDMQTRRYDAAKLGRMTENWYAPGTGPNAELTATDRVRNRSRDLIRNNPWAAGIPNKVSNHIVGTGIFPRLIHPDLSARRIAKDIWNRAAENSDLEELTDIYAQQSIGARAFVSDGEFLVRYFVRPLKNRTDFPLKCQVLEADYLDASKSEALSDGSAIVLGVQYNSDGTRAGYWLYDEHPGESYKITRRYPDSHFVPADQVDHVFDQLRPGQARGVSMFASVAIRLHAIDDLEYAEMMRRATASCFGAFVQRSSGPSASPLAPAHIDKRTGERVEKLSAGRIDYLQEGEEIKFSNPPEPGDLGEILKHDLRAAAAGAGITYEMLTGDLSGVNFISGRLGRLDYRALIQRYQWLSFRPMLLRRYWNRVGLYAAIMGLRKPTDPWTADWIMPPFPMLSPVDEVKAKTEAVRSNLGSPLKAIGEMSGEDPDDIFADISVYNQTLDGGKMISDMDPRKVGKTSAATPAINSDKSQS